VGRTSPISGGALAEFAILPATALAAIPDAVSLEEAAAIPTTAGTAWQALFEIAKLKARETVLVHAGAGGVGSFAIQLGRLAGARVIATASGTGVELARELGADQVIDYRRESFAEKLSDVDVVLDTVGGPTQQQSLGVMRAGGRLVSVISPPDDALAEAHRVEAAFVFHQSDASRLGVILGLLEAGSLRVLVDRRVSLKEVGGAFEHQRSGHARGKIIVSID